MGQAKNLIQEIQRGRISPVYLLHGEETYLIEDTLEEIVGVLAPKNIRDFNLDVFSDPEVSVDEVLSIANTYPVMSDRRVVAVKDPAFLIGDKKIDPLEIFFESVEAYSEGNLRKSASLLIRSLNLDLEKFTQGGNELKKAIEAFKKSNESELSSDELEFLDNTPYTLIAEIEVISTTSPAKSIDRLLEYIRTQPSPTTILIIALTTLLDNTHKLVKAVTQAGKVLSFGKLRASHYITSDPMYQMVRDRLKEYNKTISPDAFSELQKKTGNEMRQVFDELDKLVTFVGERQQIGKNDVEEVVAQTGFDDIFDLTNAIGQRSLPLALANLKSMLEEGDKHPVYIHVMLTRQIRFLLQAKLLLENGDLKPDVTKMSYNVFQERVHKKLPAQLIEKLPESKQLNLLKQHPYPLHLILRQAGNFTIQELTNAMERLLEADIQLKTGRLTPELVIEMLIVDIVNSNQK